MIQKEFHIGNARGDHRVPSSQFLSFRFALPARQFRRDYFGVVERSHDISMTRQMGGEKGGGAAMGSAGMRVDDQRPVAGAGLRIAHSLLFTRAGIRDYKGILRYRT